MGLYVATVELADVASTSDTVLIHNTPGRAVAVHPATGRGGRRVHLPEPRDRPGSTTVRHRPAAGRRRRRHTRAWDGEFPSCWERFRTADDVYFDSVSRVRLDRWSRGRIVLLGDAASCLSLFGEGSSLAIAGAATLADALAADSANPVAALQAYEAAHRRLTTPRQRWMGAGSRFVVPSSAVGIRARNTAMRLWAAGVGRSVGQVRHLQAGVASE